MNTVNLTHEEVADICKPLTQHAAQVRFLRGLGLRVERRPDGSPLVNRAHYNAVMGCITAEAGHSDREQPCWSVPV